MYTTYSTYEVGAADRRQRFEASADRHRLVRALRRHRPVAVDGTTSPVALPSIPLGRTPGRIDRQAA